MIWTLSVIWFTHDVGEKVGIDVVGKGVGVEVVGASVVDCSDPVRMTLCALSLSLPLSSLSSSSLLGNDNETPMAIAMAANKIITTPIKILVRNLVVPTPLLLSAPPPSLPFGSNGLLLSSIVSRAGVASYTGLLSILS